MGKHVGGPKHRFQTWNDAVSLFKGRILDQSPKATGVARKPEQKQPTFLCLGWEFWNTSDQQRSEHTERSQDRQEHLWTCMERRISDCQILLLLPSHSLWRSGQRQFDFYHFCPSSTVENYLKSYCKIHWFCLNWTGVGRVYLYFCFRWAKQV